MLDEKLGGIPLGARVHDGEVVIDTASDASTVVKYFAFLADYYTETGFKRRDSCHATSDTATYNKYVRVNGSP
jgi:hypothetical protein